MKKFVNSVAKFDWAITEVEKLRDFLIETDGDFENMEEIATEIRGKRAVFIQENFFCAEDECTHYVVTDNENNKETFDGVMIAQNKLIDELSVGYMLYFKTPNGLKRFSTFNWTVR